MLSKFYRGKKVLVIGHTGFKGSWLTQWLIELGAQVGGYSLGTVSQPNHFEVLGLEEKIKHFQGDIRDYPRLLAAITEFKPEIVFHLAAQALVRPAYDDPKTTFDTNVGGTVNVLEALRNLGTVSAAVIITSDKCYENVEWDFGYREPDRLGGADPYSASKAAAEIVFSAYARSYFNEGGCPTLLATARAGNVIGGGDWAKDRIVADCVRSWSTGKATPIRNPRATRPWQHVLEPLSGYLTLGMALGEKAPDLHGESFNFGPATDVEKSVEELIKRLANSWPGAGWNVDKPASAPKKEAGLLKLNCDKALRRLNWRATLSMHEAIDFTGGWYQKFYGTTKTEMVSVTRDQIRLYCDLAKERSLPWVN